MFEFIVSTQAVDGDAAVAIAGTRAGATGVVDLQFHADPELVGGALRRVSDHSRGPWGVHVDDLELLQTVLAIEAEGLETVLVSAATVDELAALIAGAKAAQTRTLAVATSVAQAIAAQKAGADAVVAKGSEAGGWVGEEGAFVLLQRIVATLALPVYVQGGIGRHTVAAAYVGGAAGAVLDGQLLLTRESPLAAAARTAVAGMDGSETVLLGDQHGHAIRVYGRPGSTRVSALSDAAGRADSVAGWRAAARDVIAGAATADGLPPLGQDAALAADLGARFDTVAGVLTALRRAIADATASLAGGRNELAPDSPLAQSHGTRYPIVQGPMTRVSDSAEFAAAVAEAGALPFLALALMRGAGGRGAAAARRAELLRRPALGRRRPRLRRRRSCAPSSSRSSARIGRRSR